MDEKYPVIAIARERLKAMGKDMDWLEKQTGRTRRWYNGNPEIDRIEYQVLQKMSKALKFDFIAEHRKFLGEQETLSAEKFQYESPDDHNDERKIHLQMKIAGTISNVRKNYPKLLKVLEDEGAKLGFEIM